MASGLGSVIEWMDECFICKCIVQKEENRDWYCSDPGHAHLEIETCEDCGRILCEATEDVQLNMTEHQTRHFPSEHHGRVLKALEWILPSSCSFDLVRKVGVNKYDRIVPDGDESYFSIEIHQTLVKSARKIQ